MNKAANQYSLNKNPTSKLTSSKSEILLNISNSPKYINIYQNKQEVIGL